MIVATSNGVKATKQHDIKWLNKGLDRFAAVFACWRLRWVQCYAIIDTATRGAMHPIGTKTIANALGLFLAATAHAEPPVAPATAHEAAAAVLVAPLQMRAVIRNGDGGYDVWLQGNMEFEKTIETARKAITAKRALFGTLRLERWTPIDADKTVLVDLVGGERPWRLRLSRHLTGSMVEIEEAGDAEQAQRWTPPFRPQPVYLLHGPVLR